MHHKYNTNSDKAVVLLKLGNKCFDERNFNEAISCYTEALNLDRNIPGILDAILKRGRCYIATKDYMSAIMDFNLVLHYNENNIDALTYRGIARKHIKSIDQEIYALNDLTNAIKLATRKGIKCPLAYETRGLLFYRMKNYSCAISDFTHAINFEPNLYRYLCRGNIYFHDKNYKAALKDYYCAYKLEPQIKIDTRKLEICLNQCKDFYSLPRKIIFEFIKRIPDTLKQRELIYKCITRNNPLGERILDISSNEPIESIIREMCDYLKFIDHKFNYYLSNGKLGIFRHRPLNENDNVNHEDPEDDPIFKL